MTAWPSYDDKNKTAENNFDESWGEFEDLPTATVSTESQAMTNPNATAAPKRAPRQTNQSVPTKGEASSDWNWDAWEGNRYY